MDAKTVFDGIDLEFDGVVNCLLQFDTDNLHSPQIAYVMKTVMNYCHPQFVGAIHIITVILWS
jgi:hypothetical protein